MTSRPSLQLVWIKASAIDPPRHARMKSYVSHLMRYAQTRSGQRNVRLLLQYLLVFLAMVIVYSLVFHGLMLREGQRHSWLTGFYWTLTVMSTLGFGDITFHTDLGRAFSMVVLLSGMAFHALHVHRVLLFSLDARSVRGPRPATPPREHP
jgi:hypothetical protein